ncbi:MAG: 2-dehydropantoate 2-reductase [Bacillota bacterium]
MKVAVFGAGAMGSLFGGFMAEHGHLVTLVDVWKEHVHRINEYGLELVGVSGDRTIRLTATLDPGSVGPVDLLLVFVKAYHTSQAMESAQPLVDAGTTVATFQNGIGSIEAIVQHVSRGQVLAGVTSWGATVLGPGRVRHAGVGDCFLGELDGAMTQRLDGVSRAFNEAMIPVKTTDNILGLVWTKLMANVAINPLTAILRVHNGDLLDHPGSEELGRLALAEAVAVAKAKGIRLLHDDPQEMVREVCRKTASNRSSMLQDVMAGRKTEIGFINGAIVREGDALGIPTPVNLALTRLVQTIERTYDCRVT